MSVGTGQATLQEAETATTFKMSSLHQSLHTEQKGKKGTAWRRRCCQFAETGRYTVGTVATCSTIRRCLPNWLHPRRTVSMLHTFCRSRNGKSGAQSKRLSRNWKELRYSVRQVCNLVSTVKPPAVSGPPTYIVGGYWMETGIPDHDTLLAPRPCFVFFFLLFLLLLLLSSSSPRQAATLPMVVTICLVVPCLAMDCLLHRQDYLPVWYQNHKGTVTAASLPLLISACLPSGLLEIDGIMELSQTDSVNKFKGSKHGLLAFSLIGALC